MTTSIINENMIDDDNDGDNVYKSVSVHQLQYY